MNVEILIAGVCTLGVWSYLYKMNPVFRVFESIFIATAMGTSFAFALNYVITNAWYPLSKGNMIGLIPLLLGAMCFFTFVKKYRYLYRIPIAFCVGIGTALGMRGAIQVNLFDQIRATITPIIVSDPLNTFNNIIILFGFISVLTYFIFTIRQRTTSKTIMTLSNLGRYFMMAGFGCEVGQGFLTRMAYFNGRLQLLERTDAIYLIPIAIAIVIADFTLVRQRRGKASQDRA